MNAVVPCDTSAVDEKQRFEAFFVRWVPNKALWPLLRQFQSSSDLMSIGDMPFEERTFIRCSDGCNIFSGLLSSIMIPFYAAALTIQASMAVALVAYLEGSSRSDKHHKWRSFGAIVVTMLPVFGYVLAMHEYACRVFLYHRLWEQKTIVDFKDRTWTHNAMQVKLVMVAAFFAIYCGIAHAEFRPPASFYFTAMQSFGTAAWVIYSNSWIDANLLRVCSALKHSEAAIKRAGSTDVARHFGQAMAKVLVLPEACVKYDILALQNCLAENTILIKTKYRNTRFIQMSSDVQWLKICASWVGRLGHTENTIRGEVRLKERETYACEFLRSGLLYDDDDWHKRGSYSKRDNRSGFSSSQLDASIVFVLLLTLSVFIVSIVIKKCGGGKVEI